MFASRYPQFMAEILGHFGLQSEEHLMFSAASNTPLLDLPVSREEFTDFLAKSHGSEGHPVLHLLPIKELSERVQPDCRCLAKLGELICV